MSGAPLTITVVLYCFARVLTAVLLASAVGGQDLPDRTWYSPAFGVNNACFPLIDKAFVASAWSASASRTMGVLHLWIISSNALCDSGVRATPQPKTSASAFSSNSIATFGSGKDESQGTVIRSGEYPATMSAACRGATTIARSAPARKAARELNARQPA